MASLSPRYESDDEEISLLRTQEMDLEEVNGEVTVDRDSSQSRPTWEEEDDDDRRSEILAGGGGFVLNGRVDEFRPVATVNLDWDEDWETVELSSDEEEAPLGDDEVAVVTIRPLSKSRLIPPRREDEGLEEGDTSTEITGEDRSEINIQERKGYIKVRTTLRFIL